MWWRLVWGRAGEVRAAPLDCRGAKRRLAMTWWGRQGVMSEDVVVEVAPGGVGGFDEGEFVGAGAGFELLFSADRGGHVGVLFVMDEKGAVVF